MKKFILSFIACIAVIQSTYAVAATPALTESLLEYEAIISAIGAPEQVVIPVTEFIVDIKRLTKEIDILGEVKYLIVTRSVEEDNIDGGCYHGTHHRGIKYIAELNVSPNPGIGPNIVTVLSITPAHCSDHHHHHCHDACQ